MLDFQVSTHRRGFLGTLAAGAAGLAGLFPFRLDAQPLAHHGPNPAFEAWLNRITGTHKIAFDAPEPNSGMPVVWPRIWLNGLNDTYGTTDAQNSAVVVLRHGAIGLALQDAAWAKYHLGEVFDIKDGDAPATRNPFAKALPLPLPGTGVEALLGTGVLIGVCDVALTVNSAAVAKKMNLDPAAVKADWVAAVIPGVQIVPSGVLAVSRAQDKGCGYCFAG